MIRLDRLGSMNDASRWRFSIGCSVVFLLICSVPISARMMLLPIIGVQNGVLNAKPKPSEVQRRWREIEEFVQDKRRVASDLLGGRRVTYFEALNWKPPYISSDPNASPLSREIANWQHALNGAAENPMQSGEPEPKKGNQAPSRFDRFLTPEDLAIREANGRGQQE